MLKYFLIILTIFLFSCKKKDPPQIGGDHLSISEEGKRENEQIRLEKQQLRAKIKNKYDISFMSPDKDAAVENFLNEISQKKQSENYDFLFSTQELREIYLPNTVDDNSLVSNTTIEKGMYMLTMRRKVGIDKLYQVVKDKKIKITKISWSKRVDTNHALKFHIIKNVYIEQDGKVHELEELKAVVEHQGKFKLCIIGP